MSHFNTFNFIQKKPYHSMIDYCSVWYIVRVELRMILRRWNSSYDWYVRRITLRVNPTQHKPTHIFLCLSSRPWVYMQRYNGNAFFYLPSKIENLLFMKIPFSKVHPVYNLLGLSVCRSWYKDVMYFLQRFCDFLLCVISFFLTFV